MVKEISSIQNPLIKNIALLKDKSRERKRQQLFIIEGDREIMLAIAGGIQITTLLFCETITTLQRAEELMADCEVKPDLITITQNIYKKLALRETTEGMLAIATLPEHPLERISFTRKNPLVLVVESVEKPGNLGALLRTADAADADAVIVCDPRVDFYNPNVIRSSVGCVFTRQVAAATTAETIAWLQKHHINIYATALTASVPYHTADFTRASAIVMGTEATGISAPWLEASHSNIIIPMRGVIDSMNVSVSAAIVIFEAARQRDFK